MQMFYAHYIKLYNIFNFYKKWKIKMQSISSTMKPAQTEGVCIFRTLSFLYDTGIIKVLQCRETSSFIYITPL